jgi:1-acyl-sn-glycerol-3-phosphate acyltransferase
MFPPEGMPPVKNWPLYVWRVFGKWFSFFIFGLGSLVLALAAFPVIRIVFHSRKQFKKYGRILLSLALRLFCLIMHIVGVVTLKPDNRKKYRHLTSKIIVANHPSLLDVVMLLSLIPNADCIVNTYLDKNFVVKGVIRQLFILNSLDLDTIMRSCDESLKDGNCLIIFPEGTRTPRSGKVVLKKGAARVALYSGCNILPIHIGGTDKYGLGKRDPWYGFNTRYRYIYNLTMGPEISPEKYRDLPAQKAVRAITKELAAFLFPVKDAPAADTISTDTNGENSEK